MRRACELLALAGVGMVGTSGAQEIRPTTTEVVVELELGPDAVGSGPAALVWMRDELVPTAAGWPREADPRGPIRVAFGEGCAISAGPSPGSTLGSSALAASLRVGGRLIATVRSHGRGGETIELCAGADVPEAARDLSTLLGTGPRLARDLRVDLPSLLGAFGDLRVGAEPRATQLAILAAHIGEVRLVWRHEAGSTVLHGQSAGGLVVPLVLAWSGYANLRAGRTSPLDEGETLTIRSQALRGSGREEAARQLARIATPRARETLLRLCRADEYTRVLAMESLARRGDPTTLPALVEAATESIPESIEIAREVMLAQWNSATPEQKERLLSHLQSRREVGLRDLRRELEDARLTTLAGSGPERVAARAAEGAGPSRFWLLLPLALGIVLIRALAKP